MILSCEYCKYLFSSEKLVEQCPDCGKMTVRAADDAECEEYHRIQMENEIDVWDVKDASQN